MNIRTLISQVIDEVDAEMQDIRDSARAQAAEQEKHLAGAEAGIGRFVELLMQKINQLGVQSGEAETGDVAVGETQTEAAEPGADVPTETDA